MPNPREQFSEALQVSEAVADWLRRSYDTNGMYPADLELASRSTEITPEGVKIKINCVIQGIRVNIEHIYCGDIKESVRRIALDIISNL